MVEKNQRLGTDGSDLPESDGRSYHRPKEAKPITKN